MNPRRAKTNRHDKQALRVWLQLLTLTTLIEKELRRKLVSQYATTLPRFDVLASLERAQGRMTMGELSRRLLVSKGNVTGVVGELERQGYVVRERSVHDRRTHYVNLTDKGKRNFKELAAAHQAWISDMLASSDDRRLQRLLEDLLVLKSAVTTAPREKAA